MAIKLHNIYFEEEVLLHSIKKMMGRWGKMEQSEEVFQVQEVERHGITK